MKDFQKNKDTQKIIYSKPFLIGMIVLFIFLLWGVFGIWNKRNEARQKKSIALGALVDLNKRQDELNKKIGELGTTDGTESVLRDKFRVAKEGEGLVVIVDPSTNTENTETKNPKNSFWNFWKNLFGRK